ncbi:Uncharacterised protein [Campylobacter hyointestinalis subsp. hyointestinalis]|nr:Uncharacterised protein [Campylobacter hyointestinalis subsp. hyointestinalis]
MLYVETGTAAEIFDKSYAKCKKMRMTKNVEQIS